MTRSLRVKYRHSRGRQTLCNRAQVMLSRERSRKETAFAHDVVRLPV